MLAWNPLSITAKGALQFPGQHGDFLIVDNKRARLRVVRCCNRRVRRGPMLNWKPHRSPLRAPFSLQADMPTFLLWLIQREDARALYVAAIDGYVEAPS